jgi:WD40 repeat protein
VRLWDVRAPGAALLELSLHSEPVMALALDGRARRGASGAADAQVVQFELNAAAGTCARGAAHGAAARGAAAGARGVSALELRREGRLLACAGWDGRVRLFDARASAPLASLRYHAAPATALAWRHDARGTLASASRDGTIALWEVYPPPAASAAAAELGASAS